MATYQADFPWLAGNKSLEGYYYPDTYRIRRDATMDEVIRTMLRQFDKKI
jgi:cell division protein YceG involved in septum cleavage